MSTEVMEKKRVAASASSEDQGLEMEEDAEATRPTKREKLSSDHDWSGSSGSGGGDGGDGSCEEPVVLEAGKERINPPPPPPPRSNLFRNLPPEIFLRILSQLTPHELVQSASCCREVRSSPAPIYPVVI
jgi:hypothetical protein